MANFDLHMKKSAILPAISPARNAEMSIVKGIAIILMVVGHAEAGDFLTRFIYMFHMPVFFIAAGYFFSDGNLDDPWRFCVKRLKSLYLPFVKWSLLFLVLHNALFAIGILNETYGNWNGGVTHPYTLQGAMQRVVHIIFSMGGYDEFLAGAFWFFRALLLVSLLYLVMRLLLRHYLPRLNTLQASALICVAALAFALFKLSYGLRIVTVVQGGIRETWGLFFFSFGVIFRSVEPRLPRTKWWMAALMFAVIYLGAALGWNGMNLTPKLITVATLPLTGTVGFMMLKWIARHIDQRGHLLRTLLATCGELSMVVYVFHISAFKVVSAIKIWWYDLDWAQIGCHMVVHHRAADDLFWVLYTIVGVGLPILWKLAYDRWAHRVLSGGKQLLSLAR